MQVSDSLSGRRVSNLGSLDAPIMDIHMKHHDGAPTKYTCRLSILTLFVMQSPSNSR